METDPFKIVRDYWASNGGTYAKMGATVLAVIGGVAVVSGQMSAIIAFGKGLLPGVKPVEVRILELRQLYPLTYSETVDVHVEALIEKTGDGLATDCTAELSVNHSTSQSQATIDGETAGSFYVFKGFNRHKMVFGFVVPRFSYDGAKEGQVRIACKEYISQSASFKPHHVCYWDCDKLSTPERNCIGEPEQKSITGTSKKAPDIGGLLAFAFQS